MVARQSALGQPIGAGGNFRRVNQCRLANIFGRSGVVRLSKVQSVDAPWNAVLAFANCGRAVAHVRGSYVP
jgi:hypothetical protein